MGIKIYTLLLALTLVFSTYSLTFKLVSSDPVCFKVPGNFTYVVQYVSSGVSDQNIRMEIF